MGEPESEAVPGVVAPIAQTNLFGDDELPVALRPPAYFRRVPKRLPVDFCCPRCAYGWGGNPKPTGDEDLDADPGEVAG